MAITAHILVLANRTIDAPTLLSALKRRAREGPAAFTLLVPTPAGDVETARRRVEAAVAGLRASGVEVEGRLGAEDPMVAVQEEYDNTRYDEVIVATLTEGASLWLASGLPARVQRLTDAVVHHVAVPAQEAGPIPAGSARPPQASEPVLEGMLDLLHVDTNRSGHPFG